VARQSIDTDNRPSPRFSFSKLQNGSNDEKSGKNDQVSIIQPQGLSANTIICDMPEAWFNGANPAVPPGSHYEPWVWNALDKPGCVTVELYVDANRVMTQEALDALGTTQNQHERLARLKEHSNPVFDPAKHCLMSIPAVNQAPWSIAQRVLLVPVDEQQVAAPAGWKAKNAQQKPSNWRQSEVSNFIWEPNPQGIMNWLHDGFDQRVIYGYCSIADMPEHVGDSFWWVVLSLDDVRRIHSMINPDNIEYDIHDIIPRHQQYLGWWADESALQALRAAYQGVGPVMPQDWPEDDVEYVATTHLSRPKP